MADIRDVMALLIAQNRSNVPAAEPALQSPQDIESTLLAAYGGPRKG